MYVEDIKDGVCSCYATLHTESITHLTHVEGVKDVKYYVLCIQGLSPLPGGKATVFEPSALGV